METQTTELTTRAINSGLQIQYLLTDREADALRVIGEGGDTRDIAQALEVSDATAKTIVSSLLRKMRVPTIRFLRTLGSIASRTDAVLPEYVECDLRQNGCGDSKPLAWFPHWPMRVVCADCLANMENKIAERQRWERAKSAFQEIVHKTRAVKTSVPQIQELVAGMYGEFGGPAAFISTLADQIKEMMQLKPGSKGVIDAMMTIVKLNLEVNKFDADQDSKRLSDAELKDAMWNLVQERVNDGLLEDGKKKLYEEMLGVTQTVAETSEVADG